MCVGMCVCVCVCIDAVRGFCVLMSGARSGELCVCGCDCDCL